MSLAKMIQEKRVRILSIKRMMTLRKNMKNTKPIKRFKKIKKDKVHNIIQIILFKISKILILMIFQAEECHTIKRMIIVDETI